MLAQTLKLSELDFGEFDDTDMEKMPTLIQHSATQVGSIAVGATNDADPARNIFDCHFLPLR